MSAPESIAWVKEHTGLDVDEDQALCFLTLVSITRGALHNLRHIIQGTGNIQLRGIPRGIAVKLKEGHELATFDGEDLTRLVLAAHRHHVRVAVGAVRAGSGAGLEIMLTVREPDGRNHERHPGLRDLASRAMAAVPG